MKVRWTFSSGPSRIRGFCFSCVLSFTLLAIFGCSGGSGGSGGSGNSGGGNTTPTAELTSFSPSMATVGSLPEKITLTGSHFTTASVVWTNGPNSWPVSLTTTFVSDTELKFTIPSQYVLSPGNLYITVIDSAPPYYQYNSLYLPIVNPVPVLNYILPTSVTAGTPNFILTLSGSGFIDSTTLLVNGAEAGQYGSSSNTEASFGIPSSSISTIGPVTIALYNPPPGGGTSAAQTLNVISADNRLRTLNLSAADLGWDSAHKLLIASTLEGSASNPNSIVAIDPLQGSVTATQSLPGQPAGISVTDDGSYVYVTLPSTGQIERFILPSLTPDITFALGNDSSGLPLATASVVAAPGEPHTVAVTLSSPGYSDRGGVAVYDDGVVRSNIAIPVAYDSAYNTIVWGSDATTLYGTNAGLSTGEEDTLSVTSSGVTLSSNRRSVLGQFVKNLAFDTKTGRLVDGFGNVANAATGRHVGQFQAQNNISYNQENPFAMDSAQRVVFYLDVADFNPGTAPFSPYIKAYSLDQLNYINSMLVYGLTGASKIVRWGTSGLAISGSSHLYIIDGSFVAPSGVSSPIGAYVASSPTLTSVSPSSVIAGSPDVQLTLTGRDFTPASEVHWNNQLLFVNSVSDTQIVVTFPASSLASPSAFGITVADSGQYSSSNTLGFTVLPNLGAQTQINVLDIAGKDLAWDSTRNLLYVAVPADDPTLPNTIAVIDPGNSTINQTIPIADGPTAISLSDDGQYLYAGFSGEAIVQRYALPSFSLNLTIPTDAGDAAGDAGRINSCTFPIDVKVAPGNPQSIAVAQGFGDPMGCGAVAIYDDAIPRPTTLGSNENGSGITSLAWGADSTVLFGQYYQGFCPDALDDFSISSSGVFWTGRLNCGNLGSRVHFDTSTNLLYSDSGIITNPVGPAQVGQFSAGGLVVTDSTLKRAFVLTSSNAAYSGQGGNSYTLDIFDLNTQALLNSIVIPNVLGNPTQMVRWGSNGIAFVTIRQSWMSDSLGVLYILQGSSISGTP